jgi:serine/threonine protein kinase
MAPEVLAQEDASTASDVWSFGVFLYELANNADALPFAALSNAAVIAAVQEGRQLEVTDDAPAVVTFLVKSCMTLNRRKRPSFRELAVYLAELHVQAAAAEKAADLPLQFAMGDGGGGQDTADSSLTMINANHLYASEMPQQQYTRQNNLEMLASPQALQAPGIAEAPRTDVQAAARDREDGTHFSVSDVAPLWHAGYPPALTSSGTAAAVAPTGDGRQNDSNFSASYYSRRLAKRVALSETTISTL